MGKCIARARSCSVSPSKRRCSAAEGVGPSGAPDAKGFDLVVVVVAPEPAAGDDDAEVDRGGDRDGGDDRAGGNQAHRDGVEELALGEPVVLVDDSVAREPGRGPAGAEHDRPGFEEEQAPRTSPTVRVVAGTSAARHGSGRAVT